mgnify:FL=1
MPSQWVEWSVRSADPVEAGPLRVTPQAHALRVHWPGGGFVWNHPAAVIVERDGVTERLPVVDVLWAVRLGLLAVLGVWLFGLILLALFAKRSSSKER